MAANQLSSFVEATRVHANAQRVQICIQRGQRRFFAASPGVAEHDAWPVFSVTKTFVASAVVAAAQRNDLAVDDALARWFPAIPNAHAIRVRDLLQHSSGIPDYAALPAYLTAVEQDPGRPWDLEEILECSLAAGPITAAGGAFGYSNTNYWLLGALLEMTTERGLASLIEHDIFFATQMTDSSYPSVAASKTACGYATRWAGPAGAAWSCASDVARFFSAIADIEGLWSAIAVTDAPAHWQRPRYGLGLMIDDRDDELGIVGGHGGEGPGYASVGLVAPVHDVAVAVLAQTETPKDLSPIALEIVRTAINRAR